MVLQYSFGGKQHTIITNWTSDNGSSKVYYEIVSKLEEKHGPSFTGYRQLAGSLDEAVDKLYNQIYIFGDEHHAIPYNPKHRKQFIQAFSAICDILSVNLCAENSEQESVLANLFFQILDKLQEIVGIYLVDNAYQGKYRYRRINFEVWAETADNRLMSYELEDVLLHMTDISRLLDHLTEIQKRRLVMHLFMRYTFPEIADMERVSLTMVKKSVASAIRKLKSSCRTKFKYALSCFSKSWHIFFISMKNGLSIVSS